MGVIGGHRGAKGGQRGSKRGGWAAMEVQGVIGGSWGVIMREL